MKSTSTTSEPPNTSNLIWPLRMKKFPSKLTKGESYAVRTPGFKFKPLYKFGYIISTPWPWSTITLFTLYPHIRKVTTKASSCGWMIPILSSFKKLSASRISTLALFGSELESSTSCRAIDITLEGWEPILPGAAKMTLIVPNGGLKEAFP